VRTADRDPILEKAMRQGIISGYRFAPAPGGSVRYVVFGSDVEVTLAGCVGQRSCPMGSPTIYEVSHGPASAGAAHALVQVARTWRPGLTLKVFETTTLNSHAPDARIMLIPEAGA